MAAHRSIGLTKSLRKGLQPQLTSSATARTYCLISSPARTSARCTRQPRNSILPTTANCGSRTNHLRFSSSESSAAPKKTQLYPFHVSKGGKMVEFGGYSMPVTYSDMNISESSIWTREKASLFDVSHMLQHELTGPGAGDFLASITPIAPKELKPFQSSLSAILHPTGGIVDDCIITSLGERDGNPVFYFVTNAGNRDKDLAYLSEKLEAFKADSKNGQVSWKTLGENGLIAVQGPLASDVLKSAGPSNADGTPFELDKLYFGNCAYIYFSGLGSQPCLVSRGGYTGEDGFEISIPSTGRLGENTTLKFTETLLKTAGNDKLRLAGLGARDTLRLEAGMCLYGHDIDDNTTPAEAALGWIIPRSRRETGGFLGAETILPQLKLKKDGGTGVTRRRVGFVINDKAPAREGSKIVDESGAEIGVVTSGSPSPILGKNIAMGYIKNGFHKSGTEVGIVVRNKTRKAVVSKMPFVPSKYFKGS